MSYRIGSFNCHNMGQNASDEKIKKIAHIIEQERFDIVALQEVFCSSRHNAGLIKYKKSDEDEIIKAGTPNYPISALLGHLSMSWNAYFAAPEQARDAREGYVFLWNTKTIRLPKVQLASGEERIFYPRIFSQYKLDKSQKQIDLIRNPLYARFVPIEQPKMEFRIINTHIRFSKDSGINTDNTDDTFLDLSAAKMRLNEFNILSRTIYPKICEQIYGEQDVGGLGSFFTVLIGDYNLNLKRKWTQAPFIPCEEFEIGEGHNGVSRVLKIYNEGLTTLKRIEEGKEEEYKNQQKYSNNYDHVTLDKNRFSETNGIKFSVKKIDAVRQYDNNDFVHYRKKISDHIPICLDFENKNK